MGRILKKFSRNVVDVLYINDEKIKVAEYSTLVNILRNFFNKIVNSKLVVITLALGNP